MAKLVLGFILPFLGTLLGSSMVFFMKKDTNKKFENLLVGLAGGVMIAASIWSLIIPAIEQSNHLNKLCWMPAAVGLVLGVLFMLSLDKIILKYFNTKKMNLTMFAVTLHNIPEGMAVGVALASAYFSNSSLSLANALILSAGIAIQNFPEGAIISMTLPSKGVPKHKAFGCGVMSGIVEPIFALVTFFMASLISNILPYILAFAGATMIYVVVDELIPEAHDNTKLSTLGFIVGFLIMMILDVALG